METLLELVKVLPATVGISLLAGLLPFIERLIRKRLGKAAPPESYSDKLARLTSALSNSSKEVDELVTELASVAEQRADAVAILEQQLEGLETAEQALKQKIVDLKAVPLPAAEHFAAIIAKSERRNAWRDYLLFGLGVAVSTIVAVVLKLTGIG